MNPEKYTALHVAAECGSTKVARLLTANRECTTSCVDIQGDNPLHVASFYGKVDVLAELLCAASPDVLHAKNQAGNTPISLAISKGHVDVVNQLLNAGACPVSFDLYVAAFRGHHNVIRCLLAAGVSAAFFTPGGTSPLAAASQEGWIGIVKTLLALGIDAVGGLAAWVDALCLGAGRGHVMIIRDLLDVANGFDGVRGAQQILQRSGMSPLHYAAGCRKAQVVRILLEAGADECAVNRTGYTPLDLCCTPKSTKSQEFQRPAIEIDVQEKRISQMLVQAPAYRARSWEFPLSAKPSSASGTDAGFPEKRPLVSVRIFRQKNRYRPWFFEAIGR